MNYEIALDPARIDRDAVWEMLRGTYWSPGIRKDVVERAIANSLVIGAYDTTSGRQVGFARAVTDRATFAWVCDVIVAEPFRGHGIARGMVAGLMAHPEMQTLRRWALATRDAHGVYAPLGFAPVTPGNWMEHKLDPTRWT